MPAASMIAAMVKTLADESGISFEEAEKRWRKSKLITRWQTGLSELDGESFWKYVAGVFKKAMGIKEEAKVMESIQAALGGWRERIMKAVSFAEIEAGILDGLAVVKDSMTTDSDSIPGIPNRTALTKAEIQKITFETAPDYDEKYYESEGVGKYKGITYRKIKVTALDDKGHEREYKIKVSDSGMLRLEEGKYTSEEKDRQSYGEFQKYDKKIIDFVEKMNSLFYTKLNYSQKQGFAEDLKTGKVKNIHYFFNDGYGESLEESDEFKGISQLNNYHDILNFLIEKMNSMPESSVQDSPAAAEPEPAQEPEIETETNTATDIPTFLRKELGATYDLSMSEIDYAVKEGRLNKITIPIKDVYAFLDENLHKEDKYRIGQRVKMLRRKKPDDWKRRIARLEKEIELREKGINAQAEKDAFEPDLKSFFESVAAGTSGIFSPVQVSILFEHTKAVMENALPSDFYRTGDPRDALVFIVAEAAGRSGVWTDLNGYIRDAVGRWAGPNKHTFKKSDKTEGKSDGKTTDKPDDKPSDKPADNAPKMPQEGQKDSGKDKQPSGTEKSPVTSNKEAEKKIKEQAESAKKKKSGSGNDDDTDRKPFFAKNPELLGAIAFLVAGPLAGKITADSAGDIAETLTNGKKVKDDGETAEVEHKEKKHRLILKKMKAGLWKAHDFFFGKKDKKAEDKAGSTEEKSDKKAETGAVTESAIFEKAGDPDNALAYIQKIKSAKSIDDIEAAFTSIFNIASDSWKKVNIRIDQKYADIIGLPEVEDPDDVFAAIDDDEITPAMLDKTLDETRPEERPDFIRDIKSVIADKIGNLKETYRYESFAEGQRLEEEIDGLLSVVRRYETGNIPGAGRGTDNAGAGADTGKTEERIPADSRIVPGKKATTYLPDNTPIDFHYALVEADDLITSHTDQMFTNPEFPQERQPRARDRAGMQLQIGEIANKLNPERLAMSPSATSGAPIIDGNRVVESGNGRTMAIRRAYKTGKAAEYRQWVVDNARMFGVSENQADSMREPVLVRVRQTEMNPEEFARKANQGETAQMSPAEIARADAERITDGDLTLLKPTLDGYLGTRENQPFINRFIERIGISESAGYLTRDGHVTRQMLERIQGAIFQKAYRDEALLEMMIEEPSPAIRNIITGLTAAAGEFSKARLIDQNMGGMNMPDYIVAATKLIRRARQKNLHIEEIINQSSMFAGTSNDDTVPPEVAVIARFLSDSKNIRSGKRLGLMFRLSAEKVTEVLKKGLAGNVFGAPEPKPTASEIVDIAIRKMEKTEEDKAKRGKKGGADDMFESANENEITSADLPFPETAEDKTDMVFRILAEALAEANRQSVGIRKEPPLVWEQDGEEDDTPDLTLESAADPTTDPQIRHLMRQLAEVNHEIAVMENADTEKTDMQNRYREMIMEAKTIDDIENVFVLSGIKAAGKIKFEKVLDSGSRLTIEIQDNLHEVAISLNDTPLSLKTAWAVYPGELHYSSYDGGETSINNIEVYHDEDLRKLNPKLTKNAKIGITVPKDVKEKISETIKTIHTLILNRLEKGIDRIFIKNIGTETFYPVLQLKSGLLDEKTGRGPLEPDTVLNQILPSKITKASYKLLSAETKAAVGETPIDVTAEIMGIFAALKAKSAEAQTAEKAKIKVAIEEARKTGKKVTIQTWNEWSNKENCVVNCYLYATPSGELKEERILTY